MTTNREQEPNQHIRMVAQAKSVSHGVNLANYISGESANKKHPDKIFHIEDRHLPPGLDAQGISDMMRMRCNFKNNVIRIDISPERENTRNFTDEDWRDLWHDFMRAFDSIELKRKGKVYSPRTNIAGSQSSCWLHKDSRSGIAHLHAIVCRVDETGKTNNDYDIHLRAQKAAEIVARQRGWTTAREVHERNVAKVTKDCMDILKAMPTYDWEDYKARLIAKGYSVKLRNHAGYICGYSLRLGNTNYKSSSLGIGRNLTEPKLAATWEKLHQAEQKPHTQPEQKSQTQPEPIVAKPQLSPEELIARYSQRQPYSTPHYVRAGDRTYTINLPQQIDTALNDIVGYKSVGNWRQVQEVAVAMFVGLIDVPIEPGIVGGGSSNDRDWRDPRDEDEANRMRRCARIAMAYLGGKKRTGYSR